MDNNGLRENGRNKQDQYKSIHSQWMIPPHLLKDHHALTMKFMSMLAERDTAIQERNLAISEKKAALAERDMAILQRDSAIDERNNALIERDDAMTALEYRDNSAMTGSSAPTCRPGCGVPRGTKHLHHLLHMHHPSHSREMHISDAFSVSEDASDTIKARRSKRTKETNALSANKASKLSRKGKRADDDINKQVTVANPSNDWKTVQFMNGSSKDLNNKQVRVSKPEWKGQELGLNQVAFDDSTMPVPGCSCTGVLQQCYKWGQGGWQSACCTTTLSMYPLPVMPNKRHARLGGRKMSGSVFTRLLSRLAAEGHDLSVPLDLKDHWAKHGTNRYITIR